MFLKHKAPSYASRAASSCGAIGACLSGKQGARRIGGEAVANGRIDNDGDGLIDAADPDCAPPPTGNTCGNIQGNGVPRENARARFEFGIRYRTDDPAPTGSVSFNDKATPMQFDSTSISSLVITGDDATASGSGIANGLPVTFTLAIHDKPDSFSIQLSNGYSAAWTPKTGRIEIHPSARRLTL